MHRLPVAFDQGGIVRVLPPVAFGGKVYVIGGGPEPGLTVSGANEALSPG